MRSAFEPSEGDLDNVIGRPTGKDEEQSDDDLPSDDDVFGVKSPKKKKTKAGKPKKEKRQRSLFDVDSDDSLDDFIVEE